MRVLAFAYHNSKSRMAVYLEHLFSELKKEYEVKIVYSEPHFLKDTFRFIYHIIKYNPDIIYITPICVPTFFVSGLNSIIFKKKLVLHYDDLLYIFHKDFGGPDGDYSWFYLKIIKLLEDFCLNKATYILVFNNYHKKLMMNYGYKNCYIITHGADLELMKPMDVKSLRKNINLENYMTVGIVASFGYVKKYDLSYGWDLIEALKYLKDIPVKGVFIGNGKGISILKQKAKEYSVSEKILFFGNIDYIDLPKYYNLLDICLLTQIDHPSSHIRITFKFPEYLACGRFIITSCVGTPGKLVKENGFVLDYSGIKDIEYPEKLAENLRYLYKHPEILNKGEASISIAKEHFDYNRISHTFKEFIYQILKDNVIKIEEDKEL